MNATHNGKISRLPHHIREQVHTRLRDGQPGKHIVAWLNSIPEVHQVLAASFAGRPISEANLTQWKKRAHRDWLLEQAALGESSRFVSESRQLAQAGQGAITDHLAVFVAARYAVARQRLSAEERLQWKFLRAFCHDVVSLRRGDHSLQRMRLQRDQMGLTQAAIVGENPPSRAILLTHETKTVQAKRG
ncbi:MAG: hypothetical protein ABSA47_18370 [Verrucomicrobiota bacterium]|jgi:hypothetical protein